MAVTPSVDSGARTNDGALLRLPTAIILAVIGGVVAWTAFPPVGFGPSAPVGIALFTAALWGSRARRGAGLGMLFGLAFFLPLLSWMTVIGTDAWLLLSLESALWIMLAGVGTSIGSRLPLPALWIAAAWVLSEAIRGRWPWGGFPWGSLGFSQPDTRLGDAAAVGGVPFVTVSVVVVGASLTATALALSQARHRRALTNGVILTIAVLLPGLLVPLATPEPAGPEVTIAVVQGGTPQMGMGAMDVRRAVLDNHIAQTKELAAAVDRGAAPAPDFVVWPENSSDLDPFADTTVAADISAAARQIGVPIIVGAVTEVPDDPTRVWNVAIVWDPQRGPTQMYIKTHPVPFGEYIPFRDQLAPLIGRFDRVPRDFAAGERPGLLRLAGVPVGDVICFEIAYSDVVDAVMHTGAQILVVQTNNATYGGTPQPEQQLGIERTQATATGRTVLVAATSGISAIIEPDRSISASLGVGEEGWLMFRGPLTDGLTWGTRIGWLVEAVFALLAVAAGVWSVLRMRRSRGAHAPSPRVES